MDFRGEGRCPASISESLRIRSRLYGHDNAKVGRSGGLLADILMSQGKLGSETKELLEHTLAIDTKNLGPEGEIYMTLLISIT